VIPSDHGINSSSASAATPTVASNQTMIVANIPCTGSGVRLSGFSRFQTMYVRIMTQLQPHDPTISNVAPM
jgi:hypothetical protein